MASPVIPPPTTATSAVSTATLLRTRDVFSHDRERVLELVGCELTASLSSSNEIRCPGST